MRTWRLRLVLNGRERLYSFTLYFSATPRSEETKLAVTVANRRHLFLCLLCAFLNLTSRPHTNKHTIMSSKAATPELKKYVWHRNKRELAQVTGLNNSEEIKLKIHHHQSMEALQLGEPRTTLLAQSLAHILTYT